MKKLILFLFVLLIFQSCLTTNMIKKHCADFAKICTVDSKTEIEYRDTTIYLDRIIKVNLPPDTVKIRDTVTIVNNLAYMPITHKEFGNISVDAWVIKSHLGVNGYYKDSTLLRPVHDTIFIKDAVQSTTNTNTVQLPPEKYIPKAYKWSFWIVLTSLIVGIMVIAYKFNVTGMIKKLLKK